MRRLVFLLVAIPTLLLARGKPTASGSDTLDQSFLTDNTSAYVSNGANILSLAQTFQAGLTGGITEVKLKLNSNGAGGGLSVTLSSSSANIASVPSSITVPAGATSKMFIVATKRPPSNDTTVRSQRPV